MLLWRACILALILGYQPCSANPDGPVGSISITPRFTVNNKHQIYEEVVYGSPPEYETFTVKPRTGREWAAGVDLRLPVSSYMTLSFGLTQFSRPGSSGFIPGNALFESRAGGRVLLTRDASMDFDVFVRLFIPLTSRAREELAH